MRLETLRIRNCFGFFDSGDIRLSDPGNLVYLLGRNSSGKTSVLRALSCLEWAEIPEEKERFQNYEGTDEEPLLIARFSIDAHQGSGLSAETVARGAAKPFRDLGLRFERGIEGYRATGPIGNHPYTDFPGVAAFSDAVYDAYSDLIRRIEEEGQVWVEKTRGGGYRFLTAPDDHQSVRQRLEMVSGALSSAFDSGQSIRVGPSTHVEVRVDRDVAWIESDLYRQFPDIFLFTERFSLGNELPRSFVSDNLGSGQNDLTEAFLSLLGREKIRELLSASRMATIRRLEGELNGKLDELRTAINRGASAGAAHGDFLRIFVDKRGGVRVVVEVDGKESYYEHLSDSTKFLIAYHVFQANRAAKGGRGSVLLFDEPNTGFHPSAEDKLLTFLQSLAAEGNQVVIATHSQHLIDLDRLGAIRVMGRDENNALHVHDSLYGASGASTDTLALQPVLDAIGLRYAGQLVVRDKIVVAEGYTELLYLRFFARLLDRERAPEIAPVTGEGKMGIFLPFLISQGVSFKVLLDSPATKARLREEFPIPPESFLVLEEQLGDKVGRTVGIEDLFSREDFTTLLRRCGHEIDEEHLSRVSNSAYAKGKRLKRLLAHAASESQDLERGDFSDETVRNFAAVLAFCENGAWFRG